MRVGTAQYSRTEREEFGIVRGRLARIDQKVHVNSLLVEMPHYVHQPGFDATAIHRSDNVEDTSGPLAHFCTVPTKAWNVPIVRLPFLHKRAPFMARAPSNERIRSTQLFALHGRNRSSWNAFRNPSSRLPPMVWLTTNAWRTSPNFLGANWRRALPWRSRTESMSAASSDALKRALDQSTVLEAFELSRSSESVCRRPSISGTNRVSYFKANSR